MNTDPHILIAVNGPPRSGKTSLIKAIDTILEDIQEETLLTSRPQAFSDPLYEAIAALYSIPYGELMAMVNSDKKDLPSPWFFGKTLRQVAISMSEDFLKPFHNDRGVFSKILARDSEWAGINIIDTGFREEFFGYIEEVNKAYLPLTKILLVRVHREGRDFVNDSREYITDEMVDVEKYGKGMDTPIEVIDYHNEEMDSGLTFREMGDIMEVRARKILKTIEGDLGVRL